MKHPLAYGVCAGPMISALQHAHTHVLPGRKQGGLYVSVGHRFCLGLTGYMFGPLLTKQSPVSPASQPASKQHRRQALNPSCDGQTQPSHSPFCGVKDTQRPVKLRAAGLPLDLPTSRPLSLGYNAKRDQYVSAQQSMGEHSSAGASPAVQGQAQQSRTSIAVQEQAQECRGKHSMQEQAQQCRGKPGSTGATHNSAGASPAVHGQAQQCRGKHSSAGASTAVQGRAQHAGASTACRSKHSVQEQAHQRRGKPSSAGAAVEGQAGQAQQCNDKPNSAGGVDLT